MLIISERTLNKDELESLKKQGCRVNYGFEQNIVIGPKEKVGFILDKLYASTRSKIEYLLMRHHTIQLYFEGKTYRLNKLDDWHYTYQSPKDQIKTTSYDHPVLTAFKISYAEYKEQQAAIALTRQYQELYSALQGVPSEDEIDTTLRNYANLYELDVDWNDRLNKLRIYMQIKYYLANNIEFVKQPDPEIVTSFGNEIYFDDYVCKNSCKV